MKGTYLITEFRDKDAVKSLGARWDPMRRQWFVPPGIDLTGFASWLPDTGQSSDVAEPSASSSFVPSSGLSLSPATATSSMDMGFPDMGNASTALAVPSKGIPLSQLLGGVSRAVASAFASGIWTTVELVNVRVHSGHVYLEVSERNEQGAVLAKANAVLWASQAQRVLPAFEQATGAQLAAGIKLLVRARPVFKAQYGFSLEIDAIDAEYTLGDLEARKREIRERLKQEGLFDLNRRLPVPWDFNHVLVIAPEGGAGLGDFQIEAARLQSHGICQFTYALSRFQGSGAAAEIRDALLVTLAQIELNHSWRPDAVVIIRGGGAVNDMAWLNDYALVRCVCELDIPVLTGIGHERDSTVLDEVANQRHDTPSKVIAAIERNIMERTRQAKSLFDQVTQHAHRSVARSRQQVEQSHAWVQTQARQSLADARSQASSLLGDVRLHAAHAISGASESTQRCMVDVRHLAHRQIAQAQREVPALMADIRYQARQAVRTAQTRTQADWHGIIEHTTTGLRYQREAIARAFTDTVALAHQTMDDARERSQALVREITGQGPEKTLGRGFALVRDANGQAVTSASNTASDMEIQFRDGTRSARFTTPPTAGPLLPIDISNSP